ncbi:MAG TPA: glycosyltransferase [Tepidisphaeraceae bacterium]|nr:glycosyltransferase [Tepidisphaeraceae bacterium]
MGQKVRIVHIINSLTFGGAEAMLCSLLLRTDRDRFEPSVAALIDDMSVAAPLAAAGIPVFTAGMKPGVADPRGMVRLALHLGRKKPAIVQTWMDHSNLIGGVAARAATTAKVVWGIHHSNHVKGVAKRTTLLTVAACATLSRRVPTRIVCCSEHARRVYGKNGFDGERMMVIPNGFDVAAFSPDAGARILIRDELDIATDAIAIGLIARYDPLKDHAGFLHAAAIVARRFPSARFVLCGDRVDQKNRALMATIESLGLGRQCRLLGARNDVAKIYSALDIVASSSISEAFPLVVGEAMSCGVPCAVTDVGDSAMIVGDTGRVVLPGDAGALASAMCELISMGTESREKLGQHARRRVRELFDLGAVTRRYEALYDGLVSREVRGDAVALEGLATKEPIPA